MSYRIPTTLLRPGRRSDAIIRLSVVGTFALIFSATGAYMRFASHAATPDDVPLMLSLAPANITVKQNHLVNIAVNMEVNGPTVTAAEANVSYPQDSLKLEAVQDVCPHDNFSAIGKQVVTGGVIDIACKSDGIKSGSKTLAILTFRATQTASTSAVTINGAASPVTTTDGIAGNVTIADARLDSVPQSQPTHLAIRRNLTYTAPSCARPKNGGAACPLVEAVDPSAPPTLHAQQLAATTQPTPDAYHQFYQSPCAPGGAVQGVCGTPSTFGPLLAIVDLGGYSGGLSAIQADLNTFDQDNGIAACTSANGCLKVVNQRGTQSLPPVITTLDSTSEIALDIQIAHMMCQTCRILLVLSDTNTSPDTSAAQMYAASQHPVAISDSWSGGAFDQSAFVHPGIAQFFSTLDADVSTTELDPTSFPSVIAVAGSTPTFNADGSRGDEILWKATDTFGSGGGCAPNFTTPSWQAALPNWNTAGCGRNRSIGDITAIADPNASIKTIVGGQPHIYGGTSEATPLLAAMWVMANPNGIGNQDANTLLYSKANNSNMFDITKGNNCLPTNTAHCTAGPGFDVPTGLGSPNGLGAFMAVAPTSCTYSPTVPGGLTSVANTPSSLTLGWSDSMPATNCVLGGYHLYRGGNLIGTISPGTTTYTDTGLTANTGYSYTISAFDVAGHESLRSAAVNLMTDTDSVPPSAPNGLKAGAFTSSTVSLTWTASTDNYLVTGYRVFRNGTKVADVSSTSFTDSGLSPSTSYSYTIKALDAAGNLSASSTSLTVKTLAGSSGGSPLAGDLNGDGKVNLYDLSALLSHWTG